MINRVIRIKKEVEIYLQNESTAVHKPRYKVAILHNAFCLQNNVVSQ